MIPFLKRRSIHSLALATMLFLTPTALSMQRTVVRRVRFPRGRTTMVLKGTIVNNAMNQYLLNARAGQTMSVQVKSPRGKAWFDVYPRNDRYALDDSAEDVKAWEGKLPQSGDYVISVYSDEGNTRYTLKVTVTALLISPSHAKKQTNRPKETSRRMEQWRIKIESLRSQTGIATFWDKHPKVLEFVMAREYQADGRLTICATRA